MGAVANRTWVARQSVGGWLAINWGTDRWELSLGSMLKIIENIYESLETGWQLLNDCLVTSQWLKNVLVLSTTTTTDQRQVVHQSPNSPWPPSAPQKPFYIKLVTERFLLQQAKSPCKLIVLVTFLWPLKPACNLPTTSCNCPKSWLKGSYRSMGSYLWLGLNFNALAFELRPYVSDNFWYQTLHVITYPYHNLSQSMLVKGALVEIGG